MAMIDICQENTVFLRRGACLHRLEKRMKNGFCDLGFHRRRRRHRRRFGGGYCLAPPAAVLLLERETQPGYHTTGRSAALFIESYGPPQVRALTRASRAFYARRRRASPASAADAARRAVRRRPGQEARSTRLAEAAHSPRRAAARRGQTLALVPVLRAGAWSAASTSPTRATSTSHALHQGYLRGVRRAGGRADRRRGRALRRPAAWQLARRRPGCGAVRRQRRRRLGR